MTDKLMHVYNDDTQNYPFCSLHLNIETFRYTKLNEPTNQKSPKLLSQRLKKCY